MKQKKISLRNKTTVVKKYIFQDIFFQYIVTKKYFIHKYFYNKNFSQKIDENARFITKLTIL